MLTALAVAALGRSLARRPGFAGALAALAAGAAVVSAAVLAAGSVADAGTTGRVVGTLVHAVVGLGGSSTFLVADGVRWCAEALSTVVGLFQGLALLGLGLSAALGRDGSRILGLLGAGAGATCLAAGLVRAHAGFPGEDPRVLVPAVLLGTAFLVGLALRGPGRGPGGPVS
jgi:hypothetical protein